jgi:hypothetical protein
MSAEIRQSLQTGLLNIIKGLIRVEVNYSEKPEGQRILKIDIPLVGGYCIVKLMVGTILVYTGYIEL